jgi:S1-C subfamily serine protease
MNRYRYLIIAGFLVGTFVYLTSMAQGPRRFFRSLLGEDSPNWAEPVVARGAGLGSDELNNIDIYKSARLATVNITSTVYRRDWFFQVVPSRETGSGVILGDDGRILTNNHVLAGSNKIFVTLSDHSKYDAEVLVRDPSNDLGLIRITPKKKLPFLRLGDSDTLQVGQKVLAIGNPFGLEGTLTTGIVSSLGRDIQDEGNRFLEGMIQTDAAINPGNSGGPLLDSQGSVIGINTAIYGPGGNIGIGFAMPINRAKVMLSDYKAGRSFKRSRLGVEVAYVTGDLAEALQLPKEGGLLVQGLVRGSPAAAAGIRGPRQWVVVGNTEVGIGGDLIMAIDGRPADRNDAIVRAIGKKRPGDTVELQLYRDKRTLKLTVKLGETPDDQPL